LFSKRKLRCEFWEGKRHCTAMLPKYLWCIHQYICGFDSRWCHLNFFIGIILPVALWRLGWLSL